MWRHFKLYKLELCNIIRGWRKWIVARCEVLLLIQLSASTVILGRILKCNYEVSGLKVEIQDTLWNMCNSGGTGEEETKQKRKLHQAVKQDFQASSREVRLSVWLAVVFVWWSEITLSCCVSTLHRYNTWHLGPSEVGVVNNPNELLTEQSRVIKSGAWSSTERFLLFY